MQPRSIVWKISLLLAVCLSLVIPLAASAASPVASVTVVSVRGRSSTSNVLRSLLSNNSAAFSGPFSLAGKEG
jgi:hypothetical protein